MRTVQRGAWAGVPATLLLLGVLAGTVGLDAAGWVSGVVVALTGTLALAAGLRHYDTRLGPADVVTMSRAVLVCGVTALVVRGGSDPAAQRVLVVLASVALVLDGVDGQVARRTGTVSLFGAALDMEVDSFLVLVLSIQALGTVGPWVLLIGTARYLLLLATGMLPWLSGRMPVRRWAKVVAAVQGIALVVVCSGLLPHRVDVVSLLVALALLVASFAHQVWWLRRHRAAFPALDEHSEAAHGVAAGAVTLLALALVWAALVAPDQLELLTPKAFARLPLEVLVLVAALALLPSRARRAAAVAVGLALGLVVITKALDVAFYQALDRPFDSVVDWTYLGSAVGLASDSLGRTTAVLALVVAALALVGLMGLMPWAVLRLSRTTAAHRRRSLQVVGAGAVAWVLLLALGAQVPPGVPVASTSAAQYAYGQVSRVPTELQDQREFAVAAADDPLSKERGSGLLGGLRGKDVLFVFVESYGRVAVQGSWFAPSVDRVLAQGTRGLDAAGFHSRSGYLRSPTFGGISWLAHSTLQSGLWVDNQQRYDVLLTSRRQTLSRAFGRAGWRTVSDIPADTKDWPPGAFYHYEKLYDSRNVGYQGPRFGYPTMPDQYTLVAFHRLELAPHPRRPVMAEIDLITSHTPWSRTPHLVPQQSVGNGSVFDGMPQQAPSKTQIWGSAHSVQAAYAGSIRYSLQSLVEFLKSYGDSNTVVVFMGDHQPATIVSGAGASHDVPVAVVAHDPAVLDRMASWRWRPGLDPGPTAPVMRMDRFRDRFLETFRS